jgi:hypothetical protein
MYTLLFIVHIYAYDRLLHSWKEGQGIGVTGGRAAPITAVIKNTRLGLGANTKGRCQTT